MDRASLADLEKAAEQSVDRLVARLTDERDDLLNANLSPNLTQGGVERLENVLAALAQVRRALNAEDPKASTPADLESSTQTREQHG